MDIAEIRKRTRSKAKTSAAPLPGPAAPPEEPLAATGPGGFEAACGQVPDEPEVVPAEAGLDRLFSGADTARFVAEDAYQSALVAQDDQEHTGFLQCLAFQLGPEEYALDITRISEIIKPRECTDIPRVPEFIVGLISLRGVVVPVMDLRRRFNLGEGLITPASRIVVCKEGEAIAGLLVDSITQVLRLASDQIEPPPAVLSGIDRQLVDGVGRHQGRMVILLNLATVLDLRTE